MDRMKKKKLIRNLIIWGIVVIALLAFAYVLYLVYTQPEGGNYNGEAKILYMGEGPKSYVMENDALKFELDPETTHFTLTDKKSGKVWRSNPEKWAEDKNAPIQKNKEFLACTLSVVYSSFGADIEWNNYTYSINNKNYNITQLDDGSVMVEYTIGQIEREYIIPVAIEEERFNTFIDAMGKKNGGVTKKLYSKKDPAKLKPDEMEELSALYPTVTEKTLYILK